MSGGPWSRRAALAGASAAALAWTLWPRAGGPAADTTGPATGSLRILRRGNGPEPETLDLHAARSEPALTILRDLYEGLTAIDADGLPVLAAAGRHDVSPDGRVHRFQLRDGVRWSNGESLGAEDFAAAWRRLVDPQTGAQYADILSMVRGAAAIMAGTAAPSSLGVTVPQARILEVELERPTPFFPSVLAHPATFPINRGVLARHGRGYAKPGVMVSNGAFVLTRWEFGSHLAAARNRRYWNDTDTRLDGVEYYSFSEAATELRAFRTGQIDVTSTIPAAQVDWIRAHLGPRLHVAPQLAVYYFGLNLRKPPFDRSPALRRALSLVIDREQLVRGVLGAGEQPAYTFVPTAVHDYAPPLPAYATWPRERRIARARQLLAEAGFDRAPPRFELAYNSGELHARIAIAVAEMWKEALGIEATLRAEEFKVLLADIDRGDCAVFRASWLGDYNDAYGFLAVLAQGSGINPPHYANPRYDAILERAAGETDAGRRRALLESAEALMLEDQPVIPLYFYVSKHLVAEPVRGWRDNAMNVVYTKNLEKLL